MTYAGRGVDYRVWATESPATAVLIEGTRGQILRDIALESAGGNVFAARDPAGLPGDRYRFRLANGRVFPDPFSRWQPEGVHGPSMVIDAGNYRWADGAFIAPKLRDLVIYELHVGAFTGEGTFEAAASRLTHLSNVGINAIELMPIGEFAGHRNWGYDGAYLYAPSHSYGHPDTLRQFVDHAHALGIAVVLDVVYNHFGPDGNYLPHFVGSFLDEARKTPWGGAIKYGDVEFKRLREIVVANSTYWMDDFHIDGFRLDATHEIYDDSTPHILAEIASAIQARGGFVIAEDARNEESLLRSREKDGAGINAVWADDFHHVVRVANTNEKEGYLQDFDGSLPEIVDVMSHGWLYRGQKTKSSGKKRGTTCLHLSPHQFIHCIANHDQTGNHAFGERLSWRIHPAPLRAAEALLCLTPYTPMLFMGQEWAASTPFLFFTDHNPQLGEKIREGRRNEFRSFKAFRDPTMLEQLPDPQSKVSFLSSQLNWEEIDQDFHASTLLLYKECLALRRASQAFRPIGRDSWSVHNIQGAVGVLKLQTPQECWLVVFDLIGGHSVSLSREPVFMPPFGHWDFILSTEEKKFGGVGRPGLCVKSGDVCFQNPETVLLRASRSR